MVASLDLLHTGFPIALTAPKHLASRRPIKIARRTPILLAPAHTSDVHKPAAVLAPHRIPLASPTDHTALGLLNHPLPFLSQLQEVHSSLRLHHQHLLHNPPKPRIFNLRYPLSCSILNVPEVSEVFYGPQENNCEQGEAQRPHIGLKGVVGDVFAATSDTVRGVEALAQLWTHVAAGAHYSLHAFHGV